MLVEKGKKIAEYDILEILLKIMQLSKWYYELATNASVFWKQLAHHW